MKLFYKQYGESGKVIFILHGIFGMLDNWHTVAKALSESYRVYTIDARNHGQSPHSEEMSYDLMAKDIDELAKDIGIDSYILMGHSMGGKTAMRTALTYPASIEKLIVVDIAPKSYPPGHTAYFSAFEEIDWNSIQSRKEVDDALSVYEKDAGVRLFLAKNIDRKVEGGFTVKTNIKALKDAYNEIIGQFPMFGVYEGKTLFITGEKSRYVLNADKELMQEHFPNSTFSVIPNAGHWVHADNPIEFIAVLKAFLT